MGAKQLSVRSISRHGEKGTDGNLTLEGERQAGEKGATVRQQTEKSAAQVTRILSAAQPRVRHTSRIIADELPHGEDDVEIDASTYNNLLGEAFLGDKNDPESALTLLTSEMKGDETANIPPKSQDEVVQVWIDGGYNDMLDKKYRPETLAKKQLRSILKYAKRLQENPIIGNGTQTQGMSERLENQNEMAVIGIQQFVITPLLNELSCGSISEWRAQPGFTEGPTFFRLKENMLNPQTVEFEDTILLEVHFRGQFITLTLHELQEIYRFLDYKIQHDGETHPEYNAFVASVLRRYVQI